MIYEAAVVAYSDLDKAKLENIKNVFKEVTGEGDGSILHEDDWGVKVFGQATEKGATRGHYLYFVYRGATTINTEINRRLGINENVIKSLFVRLGKDSEEAKILKKFRPISTKR